MIELGALQVAPGWAAVTGRGRVGTDERALTVIIEQADPLDEKTSSHNHDPRRGRLPTEPDRAEEHLTRIPPLKRASPRCWSTVSPTKTARRSRTSRSSDIRRYLKGPGSLRLGGAQGSGRRASWRAAGGVRASTSSPSRTRAHGHQRPEARGVRLVAVRRAARGRAQRRRADRRAKSPSSSGPQLHRLGAPRTPSMGFAEVRRRCEQEPELLRHGPAYVLYALMDAVVDRYFPVLDDLAEEAREHRGAHLQRPDHARPDRGALRPEAKAGAARSRHRPAARGGRQAPRRPRAAHLRRSARLLPRRLRPPACA